MIKLYYENVYLVIIIINLNITVVYPLPPSRNHPILFVCPFVRPGVTHPYIKLDPGWVQEVSLVIKNEIKMDIVQNAVFSLRSSQLCLV